MDEATIRYWRRFEEETGERPGPRAMGQWQGAGRTEPLWGLLVLTDRSLRFRSFPSESWMERLFAARPGRGGGGEELEIVAPLAAVVEFRGPPRGFWRRLFGPSALYFSLSWREEGGSLRLERFVAQERRFLEALEGALGTARG